MTLHRVAPLETARDVHDVHDERRALDMAQELVTKSLALARALDEAGDIGHDIGVLARAHHAEVRHRGRVVNG